jgi:uncharacterized protein (TIGR02246 family)
LPQIKRDIGAVRQPRANANAIIVLCASLVLLANSPAANAQTKQDEESMRRLPEAFSAAFNKHDGKQLAAIMSENVDFVTVGLTWLQGRADFETYHTRLFADRFKEIEYRVLQTHVRVMRPDLALVRHSWSIQGDKNVDGSARPPRFGLMTMVAEKRADSWVIASVQNVNGPTTPGRSPEAEGIKTPPIVVPRPK